jgi:hypothetical protein
MATQILEPGGYRERGDTLEWPDLRLAGPRKYVLLADYVIEWQAEGVPRQRLVVPEGFECDGASVPALLEWYLGRDRILPAAVPHDWQYRAGGRLPSGSHLVLTKEGEWREVDHLWTRKESDRFFARNLRFCDIRPDQRRNAYRAVRLFGIRAWKG